MPKKTKQKKQSYRYNPENWYGYLMIANTNNILFLGSVQQRREKLAAEAMLREVFEEQRRRDRERDREYEKKHGSAELKKLKEYEELERKRKELLNGPKYTPPKWAEYIGTPNMPGMPISNEIETNTELGKTGIRIGQRIGDVAAHRVPLQPDDYGVGDLLIDNWNAFFKDLNDLQAKDAVGYQARAMHDKDLIDAYHLSLNYLDEIDDIDAQAREIKKRRSVSKDVNEQRQLDVLLNLLNVQKSQLLKQYNDLAPKRKELIDMSDQSAFGKTWDDIIAGNELFGSSSAWNIAGKTTALHDELNDARRFLYGIKDFDPTLSSSYRNAVRQKLNRALTEYSSLNKGWESIISENTSEAEKHDKRITDFYKNISENTPIEFSNPDTYLFKLSGIAGGSSSSWMKQTPAMIVGLLGNAAAAYFSGGTSLLASAAASGAGGLGSFAFHRGAGISENNAEVALALIELLKKEGMSEEDVKNVLSGRDKDPRKLRKIKLKLGSAETLFRRDMAATTFDAAVLAAISAVPTGLVTRTGSYLAGMKAFKAIQNNPVVKRAVESKLVAGMSEGFKKGYEFGSTMGPGAGVVGGAYNATLGNFIVNPLARQAGKYGGKAWGLVYDKAAGTWAGKKAGLLATTMSLRVKNIVGAGANMPVELIEANALKWDTRKKYLKDISGRAFTSFISEGIEEGKQHVNAEDFKAGMLPEEYESLMKIAFVDTVNGFKMGAYTLGIPLDAMGIINIKDLALLQEIKGGMMGGFGHAGTVAVVQSAIPYVREQGANKVIAENLLRERIANEADYKQYLQWLESGWHRHAMGVLNPGRYDVRQAFERLRRDNNAHHESTGDYILTPEEIDQAERDYNRVVTLANSPVLLKAARSQGIETPSIKNSISGESMAPYREFVAQVAVYEKQLEGRTRDNLESKKELLDAENRIRIKYTRGTNFPWSTMPVMTPEDESDPNSEKAYYDEESDEFIQSQIFAAAKLASLLMYKQQLQFAHRVQTAKDNKGAVLAIEKQLESLENEISEWRAHNENFANSYGIDLGVRDKDGNVESFMFGGQQVITTLRDLELLVFDPETHDELTFAMLQELKTRYELKMLDDDYHYFLGIEQRIDEDGETHDLTDEDRVNWNHAKDLKHLTFRDGHAKEVIAHQKKIMDENDDYQQQLDLWYLEKNDLEKRTIRHYRNLNDVIRRKKAAIDAETDPAAKATLLRLLDEFLATKPWIRSKEIAGEQYTPLSLDLSDQDTQFSEDLGHKTIGEIAPNATAVRDKDGLLVKVEFDSNGRIVTPIAANQFADNFGMLWEIPLELNAFGLPDKSPFNRNGLVPVVAPMPTLAERKEAQRDDFACAWFRLTGAPLPISPDTYTEQIIRGRMIALAGKAPQPYDGLVTVERKTNKKGDTIITFTRYGRNRNGKIIKKRKAGAYATVDDFESPDPTLVEIIEKAKNPVQITAIRRTGWLYTATIVVDGTKIDNVQIKESSVLALEQNAQRENPKKKVAPAGPKSPADPVIPETPGVPEKPVTVEPEPEPEPIVENGPVVSEEEPETPPVPPVSNPPIIPASDPNDDPQKVTLDWLKLRASNDKNILVNGTDGYVTTGYDYFVRRNGKITRASRVHTAMPESYENRHAEELAHLMEEFRLADTFDKLTTLINSKIESLDDEDIAKKRVKSYIQYISDNKDAFFSGNITEEDKLEFDRTLDHLSKLLTDTFRGQSVDVGNMFDALNRDFFGSDLWYTLTQTEDGIRTLFEQVWDQQRGLSYKDVFTDNASLNRVGFDVFKNLILQMRKLYEFYTIRLGWLLFTDPITWNAVFDGTGLIAGQTDMLGVDKDGNIHIIDFKTGKPTFGRNFLFRQDVADIYRAQLSAIRVSDFSKSGKPMRKAKELQELIRRETGNNRLSVRLTQPVGQNGTQYATVFEEQLPFFDLVNKRRGPFDTMNQLLSKNEDYSNLQTAYAELINRETGGSVSTIEILAYQVGYSKAAGIPFSMEKASLYGRIRLPRSGTMLGILNGTAVQNAAETLEQQQLAQMKQNVHNIFNIVKTLKAAFDGDVNNVLDELHQLRTEQAIEDVENAYSDFMDHVYHPADLNDITEFKAIYDKAQAVLDLISAAKIVIDEAYAYKEMMQAELAAISAEVDRVLLMTSGAGLLSSSTPLQPANPVTPPTPPTPPAAPAAPLTPQNAPGVVYAANKTTKVYPGEMTRLYYKDIYGDPDLEVATSEPDFIQAARMELFTDGLDVYCNIYYHGRVWEKVRVEIRDNYNVYTATGIRLLNTVKQLLALLAPNEKIVVLKASRTNGGIKRLTGDATQDVNNTDLFVDLDIYDLEFSSQYGRLGYIDARGNAVTFVGDEENATHIIWRWPNPANVPARGSLIYLIKRRHNEKNGDVSIPVAIDRRKLLDDDIDFILNALSDPVKLDSPVQIQEGSTWYNIGATHRQLINLLIPVIDDAKQLTGIRSILRNPSNPNIILVGSRENFASSSMQSFDISTQSGIDGLKTWLASRSISERHDVLKGRLGNKDYNTNLPFTNINDFFLRVNSANNITVSRVSVTSSLVFDIEDFMTKTTLSGATRQGLSGFGWYLKHNLLITQYDHVGATNVRIDQFAVEKDTPTASPLQQEPLAPIIDQSQFMSRDDDPANSLFKIQHGKAHRRLTKERALRHLKQIFGEEFGVEEGPNKDFAWLDNIIASFGGDAAAVGACKADIIMLASDAERGTEWHEAFHRVFEFFVPEKRRDAMYKEAADYLGISLFDENGNLLEYAHRIVAEYLADQFMYYMKWLITGTWAPTWAKKSYNKIARLIRGWLGITPKFLLQLYQDIQDGQFAKATPVKNAIDRFNKLYKVLYFTVGGVEYKNIMDASFYDKLRNTVVGCIKVGANIKATGENIEQLGKHIDRATLEKGAEIIKKQWGYDVFGNDTDTPTVGLIAMRDMAATIDTNDQLYDDIARDFQLLSTKALLDDEEEDIENADAGEAQGSTIGDHTRSAYEFSRFSKLSSQVKFMFATIWDWQYVPVYTTDASGKKVRATYIDQEDKKQYPLFRKKFLLNELGLPQFVPAQDMYIEFLSLFHDVDSYAELMYNLNEVSREDPRFDQIRVTLNRLHKEAYGKQGELTYRNPDKENLIAAFMNLIRAHKHKFMIIRSVRDKNENKFGNFSLNLQTTDADYNARYYPSIWNNILMFGGTKILKRSRTGELVFNPKMKGAENVFARAAYMIDHFELKSVPSGVTWKDAGFIQWFDHSLPDPNNPEATKETWYLLVNVNGQTMFLDNPEDSDLLDIAKGKFVQILNAMGILFSVQELNYMLRKKYGAADNKAMAAMFNSKDFRDSISTFLTFLKDVVKDGALQKEVKIGSKMVKLENAYGRIAFIRDLGSWKYYYRHSHDLLSVLFGDKQFYEMADNNFSTDTTRMLNKRGELFEQMLNDPYVYYNAGKNVLNQDVEYGSYVMRQMRSNPRLMLSVLNFAGFKTDKRSDYGKDYLEISRREDYVAKATMLSEGHIIMPTISDKKTWFYLDGITLPGLIYLITYNQDGDKLTYLASSIDKDIMLNPDGITLNDYMLKQDLAIVDLLISYAYSERESIKKALRDIEQMEKTGTLKGEVKNFYNKKQGARFHSLLGVYMPKTTTDALGNQVYVDDEFISFNNKNNTPEKDLETADQYFFNQPLDVQRSLITRVLHKILLRELDTAESLGLIEKVLDSENPFINYKNVGFDNSKIKAIYDHLLSIYGYKDGNKLVDQKTLDKISNMALAIFMRDVSARSILSIHEVERLYTGNPSFYKWTYNEDDGSLADRTVDPLKRFGGIISTGLNNYLELEDVPQKYIKDGKFTGEYVCAEIGDELVQSELLDVISEGMLYGAAATLLYNQKMQDELRRAEDRVRSIEHALTSGHDVSDADRDFYNLNRFSISEETRIDISKKVSSEIDGMEQKDIFNELTEDNKKSATKIAQESVNSYMLQFREDGSVDDGINVADGAAYISDTMAEMLLRMCGKYSKEVQEAFKILREEVPSDIKTKMDMYSKIITTVIGSQKYTAFGRRIHPTTGILIPYYNKMALFPVFQCIATGRLLNIYQKMKEQGIDMLMFDSAVKVGSQGVKQVDWDKFKQTDDPNDTRPIFDRDFKFSTYNQQFMYLRKQMNTDPKEESLMAVKTQMMKVVMNNLFDGRTYYEQDGSSIIGADMRDDMMECLNILSDRGLEQINKRFFKTNKDGQFVDIDGNVIQQETVAGRVIPPAKSTKKVLDMEKFSNEITRLLDQKDPDKNIIQALRLETHEVNGEKVFLTALPINAISNASFIESVLISAVNKKVIDVNAPGAAFIQRSIWGMEGLAMYSAKDGNIRSDENLAPTINGGKPLLMINEEGSMDCVVSVDFFKKMFGGELPKVPIKDKNHKVIFDRIPERDRKGNVKTDADGNIIYKTRKDKNGNDLKDEKGNVIYARKIREREMTFQELRQWLINRKIIGPDAKANVVGYRVPTQAESSIHALRIVDIIEGVNDTIILPKEFTKITGSDFDIDKLYLSCIQYDVNREADEDGKYHQTVTDKFSKNKDAYYTNKLLRHYLTLLLDWRSPSDHRSRTMNILHKSIDNDTKLLKDIIKDLDGEQRTEERTYSFYSLTSQTYSKDDYVTGKIGIGPFALNNNAHILAMMYNLRFKSTRNGIMTVLGLESLSNQQDYEGNQITSWMSGLINAHVDIAKDPYISKLNVNPFTYNIVNLLIRTGFGKKTFYFTRQPIMIELAKAYTNATAEYMSDQKKGVRSRQEEAIDKVAELWFKDLDTGFGDAMSVINRIKEGGMANAKLKGQINAIIKRMMDKDLYNDAKMWSSKLMNLENQFYYFLAYMQFAKYANQLAELVKYSKIDTKKHGKSISEQYIYKQGFLKAFDTASDSNLFETSGLRRLREHSFIQHKTENAIDSVQEILAHLFIQSTIGFVATKKDLLLAIGRHDSLSVNLIKKVDAALMGYIKSGFFNQYARTISTNPRYIRDLVCESRDDTQFAVYKEGNAITVTGNMNHKVSSYVGGTVLMNRVNVDGSKSPHVYQIYAADDETGTIYVHPDVKLPSSYGDLILTGGKNTIYDRFARLTVDILSDDRYKNLRTIDGQILNKLLNMLVLADTYQYLKINVDGVKPDTYDTLKFVKFFNFIESGGSVSNYLIDAWEDLLNYTDEDKEVLKEVRDFARDLIMYGFYTSGDQGGFTKIFKYVPSSWRKESGYAQYIQDVLARYYMGDSDVNIDDVILNNWYDYEMIPEYSLNDKETSAPQFMQYRTYIDSTKQFGFASMLGAIKLDANGEMSATIDPYSGPKFIKIRRNTYGFTQSARAYTIYKRHGIAMNSYGVEYPVYVKVNPKGAKINNFIMTEYGRSDDIVANEYAPNEDKLVLQYMADNWGDIITSIARLNKQGYKEYAEMLKDLGTYARKNADADMSEGRTIVELFREWYRPEVENDKNNLYIFTDNTDRDSGSNPIDPNSKYAQKYGTDKHYPTTTQAVIRGLDNAMPLSTQRWYHEGHKGKTGQWTDDAFDEFKAVIDQEMQDILDEWFTGKYKHIIVSSLDGFFGSHISEITEERVPKIYNYLKLKLDQLEDAIINNPIDRTSDNQGVQQRQVQQSNTNSTEFYSGAAPGSDSEWGKQARALGINVKDYTGTDYRSLPKEWIDKIEKEYIKSREFLGKPVLPVNDINNDYDPGVLTRRDMMQADKADAIFAIAERIVKPGDVEMSKGRPYVNNTGHDNVAGGTANAVARGIIRGIPVYVFDQSDLQWKLWNQSSMRFEQTDEPTLTRHAATIGTRNIDDSGRRAISSVLRKFVGDNRTTTLPSTINIYAGTGENADLSNFAIRPFYDGNGQPWNSVEQAFQAAKLDFIPSLHYPNFGGPKDKYFDMIEKIEKMSPAEARKFGRTLSGLDVNNWDKESLSIMKELIKLSFEQNPQALQRLLATGNATLTHKQDRGKWGTEFPRLLMEVRDELRPHTNNTVNNDLQQDLLSPEDLAEAERIRKECKGE